MIIWQLDEVGMIAKDFFDLISPQYMSIGRRKTYEEFSTVVVLKEKKQITD